jgi:hypothetical protein
MKVAVNKRILFDLLKKRLNETRFENVYMHGAAAGDPFGLDEDLPIEPSHYSANQIFKKVPDVSNPDWSPSNPDEFGDAAKELAKAIPPQELHKLYQVIHRSLDKIADELASKNVFSESIDISKLTKIKDFAVLSEAINDDNESEEVAQPEELTDDQLEYIAKNIKRVTDELGASTIVRRIKKDVITEDDIPVHVIDIALKLYQLTLQRDLEVSETTAGDQEVFKNSFKEGYVLGHNFYAKLSPTIKGDDKKLTQSIGRQIDRYMQKTLYKGVTDIKQMKSILTTFNIQAFILGVENSIGTLEDLEQAAQIELTPEEEISADKFLATSDKDLDVPGVNIPIASEDQSRTQERQITRMLADDKYATLEELAPKSLVDAVKEVDLFIYNIVKSLQSEDAAVSLGRRIEGKDGAFVALDDKDSKLFPLHIQYQIPRFSLMFRTSRDVLIALMKKSEGSGEDKTRVIDNPESSKQFVFKELKNLIIDKAYSFPENKGMVNKMNNLAEAAKKEMLDDSEESISLLDADYEKFKKQAEETDDQKLKLSLVNKARQAKEMSDQLASSSFKLFKQELDGLALTEYILENFAEKYYRSAIGVSSTRSPETGQIDKDKFFNRIFGRMFGTFKFSQLGVNALNSIFAKHNVLRKDKKGKFNPYTLIRANTLNKLLDTVIIKDVQKAFECFLGYEVEANEEGDTKDYGVPGLKSFKAALKSIEDDPSPYVYSYDSKQQPDMFYVFEDRNKKYSDKLLVSDEEFTQRIDQYFSEVILDGAISYLNVSKEKTERFRKVMTDEEIQERIEKRSKKHFENFSLYLNQKSVAGSRQTFLSGPMRKLNLLKMCLEGSPEYLEMNDAITRKVLSLVTSNIDKLIEKAEKANKPAEITGKGFVKIASSADIAKILKEAKEDISKLYLLVRNEEGFQAIDLIDEAHELAYTPGGMLIREMAGQITDLANKEFENVVLDEISDDLIRICKKLNKSRSTNDSYNLQKAEALQIAEYFIGMKGFPNERTFELLNSPGRNKRNIFKEVFGITDYLTFKRTLEIPVVTGTVQPNMIDFVMKITTVFDQSEGQVKEEIESGLFSDAAIDLLNKLTNNDKALNKQISKVIAEYQNYKAAEREYGELPMKPLSPQDIPDFLGEVKRLRAKISKRK